MSESETNSELQRLRRENQALQRRIGTLEEASARHLSSQQEYRAILENTGTATVVVDSNYLIVKSNPEFSKLSGYSRQELEGKMRWVDFVNAADLARMKDYARLRRQAGEDAPRNYEFDLVDRHGRVHHIFMTAAMITGTDLNIASLMDITGLKRAESARRESELGFATVFHHLPHPSAITEIDTGLLVEVNQAFEELTGYVAEELIGKTSLDLGLWPDPAQRSHVLRKLKHDGRVDGYLRAMRTRSGSIRLVSMSLVKLPTRGGEHMLSIYVDRTNELAKEKFQAAILETATHMGLGICVESHSFTPNSRLDYVNEAMADMVGLQPGDLVGKMRMMDLVHQDSQDMVGQFIEDFRSQRPPNDHFDINLKRADGGKIIAEVAISQTEMDGWPALVAFCRNVTMSRKMEQQMQSAQRMEALGALAGGIAHDFNNILMAVVGYAELALLAAKGQAKLEDCLDQVIKACGRGSELVRQIITFSRGDETPLRPVSVGKLARDTLKLVSASLPPQVWITTDLDVRHDSVLADPSHINQVLMNLCTNAAQAMGDAPGEIRVSLRKVTPEDQGAPVHPELPPGPFLVLTVADTGPGIDRDILSSIFDPFFTTKPAGEGTGMGLAVVHGIVQSLSGFIEVSSTPGNGASFEIWLPLAETDSQPSPRPNEAIPSGDERILLVEDEVMLAQAMQGLLVELGYRVDWAPDGKAGLEKFQSAPGDYDLVISDQTMPNMPGTEMARHMLRVRPDLPVIIATGYGGGLTSEEIDNLGLAAFLPKPYRVTHLARLLRQVLDRDAKT